MKKRISSTILAVMFLFTTGTVCWGYGLPYISVGAGIVSTNDSDLHTVDGPVSFEFDTGYAAAVAVGTAFDYFRAELEFSYLEVDFDNGSYSGIKTSVVGDGSIFVLMMNGYFDFFSDSFLTPFVTAGIGGAQIKTSSLTAPNYNYMLESDDDTVFAYQIGAGVDCWVNEKTAVYVKYKYFATADPQFWLGKAEFSSHNIYMGLKFSF